MFRIISPVVLFLFSLNLAHASILPPNDLHKYDNVMKQANMTETEFNDAIDEFLRIWQPIARMHRGNLSAVRNWNNSTVNAFADRRGSSWTIEMFGGLARRPEVTLDAFRLVVCHELGHLFAGYHFGYYNGMASEGSADYFATQVCLRQSWEADAIRNASFRGSETPYVRRECNAVWQTENEQNLCYRTAAAGASLTALFASTTSPTMPAAHTPDLSQVTQTQTGHPAAQCRMDTYFQGALCAWNANISVIPGYNGQDGTNTPATEALANRQSCAAVDGYTRGIRPLCWFKPLLN